MKKARIVLIALIMLSLVSCREVTPVFSSPATPPAKVSRQNKRHNIILTEIIEPEHEPESTEKIIEADGEEKVFERTSPVSKIINKDYISAINTYEGEVSEYKAEEFSSTEEALTEFLSTCSPVNIYADNGTLVYSYYSGASHIDGITSAAIARNCQVDSLYAAKPDISVYYYDLETGEEFAYNENEVRDSASLAKIPYLLSVLEETDAFEAKFEEKPDYSGENHKYNLEEKWVYDSATMFKYGSGVLFEKPDGTEATWKELFSYSFINSDNIAYAQIKERFGKSSYNSLLSRLGIDIPTDERFLTARDYGLILREVYSFCKNGSRIGLFMEEEMRSANLNNIIGRCYENRMIAHKYGWDVHAYHDMGIVFADNPYIIVIMTDYDTGGDAVDRYICDIVRFLQQIHNSSK